MELMACINTNGVLRKIKQARFEVNSRINFLSHFYLYRAYMGYTYLNLSDSPELLQILMTLTTIIKPLLPNFLGRAIAILNFVRRFRNFIADTVPC